VPSNKISVLSHSVDIDLFRSDETKKIDNLVLFVSRIERIKGLPTLMEASLYLEIPVQLTMGPKRDAKYVEKIEQMSHLTNENIENTREDSLNRIFHRSPASRSWPKFARRAHRIDKLQLETEFGRALPNSLFSRG